MEIVARAEYTASGRFVADIEIFSDSLDNRQVTSSTDKTLTMHVLGWFASDPLSQKTFFLLNCIFEPVSILLPRSFHSAPWGYRATGAWEARNLLIFREKSPWQLRPPCMFFTLKKVGATMIFNRNRKMRQTKRKPSRRSFPL